jgi:hypothetical protein
MRLLDMRDPWFWRFDLHVGVNFCVWALLADGLRVSPFDRHAGGDGALRAAGLTPEGWWTWLHAVLARQEQLRAALAATDRALPREWAMGAHLTYDVWPGEPAVGARLHALWPRYEPHADTWRERYIGRNGAGWPRLTPREHRRLWRELKPLRWRLPPVNLYLVEYPARLVAPAPPATALLTTGSEPLDGAGSAAAVVCAVGMLGAAAGARAG